MIFHKSNEAPEVIMFSHQIIHFLDISSLMSFIFISQFDVLISQSFVHTLIVQFVVQISHLLFCLTLIFQLSDFIDFVFNQSIDIVQFLFIIDQLLSQSKEIFQFFDTISFSLSPQTSIFQFFDTIDHLLDFLTLIFQFLASIVPEFSQ
ncbi:MAG: hypothetical protein WCL02_03770 [bacterium]